MIRSLICLVLMVPYAAEARDYNMALTTTRAVGDPVSVPVVVMRTPVSAKSIQVVIGFDSTLVSPILPGGPVTVSGGTINAALTAPPGEVLISFTGTTPSANTALYSISFKCLKPGRCQFPVKSVTAKDAASATIPMTGDTLDWLVITDSGAIRSAIE